MSDYNNISNVQVNSVNKGMIKDLSDQYLPEGAWSHARNAINVTHTGEKGRLSNEQSTTFCVDDFSADWHIIGTIHYDGPTWLLFVTDDADESGIYFFDSSKCSTLLVAKQSCLNFRTTHPITGAVKENYDCTRTVYFADGLNPDRYLDPMSPPWVQVEQINDDCVTYVDTGTLDCEKLRIAPILKPACATVNLSQGSGQMLNGTYQVAVAYTINSQRCSDYWVSNLQSMWQHNGVAGSLDISIEADTSFDDMEVVVISTINGQTVARRLGYYSTRQTEIHVDIIAPELVSIPLSNIPLISPVYEKSDRMYELNSYLIRQGTTTHPEINYQPLANNITASYQLVNYPANYYKEGGNNVGYMRDEVYAFFIRWVYNTGGKTASYHIPGRPSTDTDRTIITDENVVEGNERWRVYDTSSVTTPPSPLPTTEDGGILLSQGNMQFWESTEKYDNDRPDIWGPLCGKNIRHHKFPAENLPFHINTDGGDRINILGVKFENIQHPVDFDGNPIPNIVGYEILRGSREGNRSVIAKGIFNNMIEYNIKSDNNIKGLMQNYPYNDLRPDEFLRNGFNLENRTHVPLDGHQKDYFSFHSPETTFSKPYLGQGYVSIYREVTGQTNGNYNYLHKHPKHVLLNASALKPALFVGASLGLLTAMGSNTTTQNHEAPSAVGSSPGINPYPSYNRTSGAATILNDTLQNILNPFLITNSPATYASLLASTATIVANFSFYAALGSDQVLQAIYNLSSTREYVAQYNSHGFYNNAAPSQRYNRVLEDNSARYVDSFVQDYVNDYRINNLFRGKYVVIKTNSDLPNPSQVDNSRSVRIPSSSTADGINTTVSKNTSTRYGAYKVSFDNQYGQIDSIRQLPVPMCVAESSSTDPLPTSTGILFGGDTYINRYTEKNAYPLFNTWQLGEPDETPFDYREHINGPYPRYWADFHKYDMGKFDISVSFDSLTDIIDVRDPEDEYNLHQFGNDSGWVRDKGVVYAFINGVRDFFVESEIDLSKRDYEEDPAKRHYEEETYTDLRGMFRSDRITAGNFYKYDYSLSASKVYGSYITWGATLPRDYDPEIAETCYVYSPNRLIYSLEHRVENVRDNWLAYLPNNFKDFDSRITTLKSMNKTGAIMLFEDDEPVQVVGVDTLQTDAGTKFTIGDGGLFEQPFQSLVNADDTLEHGSCQSYYSAVNTPFGLFYVSQKAGKIFQYADGLQEISLQGMQAWFAEYLPSKLLQAFPTYEFPDNPIAAIGVQCVYDPEYKLVYFTKRDFRPRTDAPFPVQYRSGVNFYYRQEGMIDDQVEIELGDPAFFEDCSWTVSYDPKEKMWLSFHDWHPNLTIPAYDHFFTVVGPYIHKHNDRFDSFCNFYNQDYPWEVEIPITTGLQVTTLRSVEYYLENYVYYNDGFDKFAPLDHNFDRATIHNNEQVSGVLDMSIKPKNNPVAALQFPTINPNSISILFDKEENRYRFNQFWDITNDRNEFATGGQNSMWVTQPNGYVKTINPQYINYQKPLLERKRFRHYHNRLLLRRNISGEVNMQLLVTQAKQNASLR